MPPATPTEFRRDLHHPIGLSGSTLTQSKRSEARVPTVKTAAALSMFRQYPKVHLNFKIQQYCNKKYTYTNDLLDCVY